MEILSSRILLRPADPGRSRHFYRDVLGLAVYREFGPPEDPGVVFFLGSGMLEVSGRAAGSPGRAVMIWVQVRDVHAERDRLAAAGVRILREPATESWGLTEMWIEDPDGVRIVLVEVPPDHPLRRDTRSLLAWCSAVSPSPQTVQLEGGRSGVKASERPCAARARSCSSSGTASPCFPRGVGLGRQPVASIPVDAALLRQERLDLVGRCHSFTLSGSAG